MLAEGLARGDGHHGLALHPGAYAQGAHGHVGRAAGGVGLFEYQGLGAALARGAGGGKAGQAAGYDDDISFHFFHVNNSFT